MPQVRIVHQALVPALPAAPAQGAEGVAGWRRLTDRQRLAVLLQGAGLLSLLSHAGWSLLDGWAHAAVTHAGLLAVPAATVAPGRCERFVQALLSDLLLRLFGGGAAQAGTTTARGGPLAGRGAARRAARSLFAGWRQVLVPEAADDAVAVILEQAPFLWEPAHAAARRALAGEICDATDAATIYLAGPRASRERLAAGCGSIGEVAARLSDPAARSWWEGARPPQAAAPAVSAAEAERQQVAAALFHRGRFVGALAALAGARSVAARLLRVCCQAQLGRLGAARTGLRRLAAVPLSVTETIEAAEAAVRVFANSADPAQATLWVERVLAISGGRGDRPQRARGRLIAAVAAWDGQDMVAMDAHLAAVRGGGAGDSAGLDGAGDDFPPSGLSGAEWRWCHACALRAMAAGDGPGVVLHLRRALGFGRRGLARHEAAGLWNDLGIGRVQVADLAGAERAFLHAQRLLAGCDGPRRTTLALLNLAEVRLRRGRVAGVRAILEQASAENRNAGNVRGSTQDAELWMRLELAGGNCAEAIRLGRSAIEQLGRRRVAWRRDMLAVLEARALGWLERPAEAAAALAAASSAAVAELEPEERPALWAHAGERETARATAAALPAGLAELWQGALAGEPPAPGRWAALDGLEPYRAGRLLFDLERAAGAVGVPSLAPAERCAAAAKALREAGAEAMADWLLARAAGPWEALARYAAAPAGDPAAAAELLRRSGGPAARLVWVPAVPGDPRQAAPAPAAVAATGSGQPPAGGGCGRLVRQVAGGSWELRDCSPGAAAGACFAVVVRDLEAAKDRPDVRMAAPRPPGAAGNLIGSSPAWRSAVERLDRLAAADLPVLIQGESGTGKELAARAIHAAGARSGGPFLAVNCAALGGSLVLADLFGHARGAFTGADRERAGVFETARGGTVLLDEIGDLPPAAQGLLLRVLQEKEVRRLGESIVRRIDVRVLAATHRDLPSAVAAGTFRQDLFYRLKVGAVWLPALRERGDDVIEIAESILRRVAPHGAPVTLTPAARLALCRHLWPGNVRELENVLRWAAVQAAGGPIDAHHLELMPGAPAETPAGTYHQQVENLRRCLVGQAIAAAGGRHAEAARRLGLSRQALSYLVRQLGLR